MREIVAYYRVSTKMQGADGFGMDVQRTAIARYAAAMSFTIVQGYSEVESGRREHLTNRPQLVRAVAHARRSKALLVIARFDRLARNVFVTSQLLESGVEFVACYNPHANRLTIHILAAMAEHEGRLISERTKAGHAAAKAGRTDGERQSRHASSSARCSGKHEGAQASNPRSVRGSRARMAEMRSTGLSTIAIAERLNEEGQRNQHARPWCATTVNELFRREGIVPLPNTFERKIEPFAAIQRAGVAAARTASSKQVKACDAIALIARGLHNAGASRPRSGRQLESRGISPPRGGPRWSGVAVLKLLRRHELVPDEGRCASTRR